MNFGARLSLAPQAEACSRTEDGPDRSITVTRQKLRGTHWCQTPPLCLELVLWTPSWQRSCATASTDRTYGRNRFDQKPHSTSCQQGAVHIWVPAQGRDDTEGVSPARRTHLRKPPSDPQQQPVADLAIGLQLLLA